MIEGEFKEFGIPAKLPIIPGHEITGIVEELGNSAKGFVRGDRVGVQVLWKTDGSCEFCLSGRENLCLKRQTTGEMVDGGFAEYMTAPAHSPIGYRSIWGLRKVHLFFVQASPVTMQLRGQT